METREVYRIGSDGSRSYAGYAKFGSDGSYQGSAGGYGPSQRGINPDRTGNNRSNNASMVQNAINSVAARQAARARRGRR